MRNAIAVGPYSDPYSPTSIQFSLSVNKLTVIKWLACPQISHFLAEFLRFVVEYARFLNFIILHVSQPVFFH